MEIDGGLAVKAEAENGWTQAGMSAGRLRELVRGIDGVSNRRLVVRRIPDLPDVFAQVWRETGGDYRLEHRLGDDGFFGAHLPDADRAADLLTGWARREPGWDADVTWEPVDLGPREDVPEPPDDSREAVEGCVRLRLRCGYDTRADLTQIAEDHLIGSGMQPLSRAQAQRLVDRLWLERVAEQAAWQGVTDPELLTRAFEALDASGITARENFTCCRSCGMAEIGAEREDARGFVFFHQQGTESAAQGHGLALYYGGFDGSEDTTTAVGHEVVAALRAAGLSTQWDGSPARSIVVQPLDWRRRLVG
jgi:hypothetical protein